jgi:hypothetical protein
MPKIADLIPEGFTLVGNGTPIEETTTVTVKDPLGVDPDKAVNRGTGRYYVIVKDKEGHQRALPIKAQEIKGGLEVKQSGVNDTIPDPDDPTKTRTKPNPNLFTGDLKSIQWDQAGAVVDVPKGAPSATKDVGGLQRIDKNGNDAATSGLPAVAVRDPSTGDVKDLPKDPAGAVTKVGNSIWVIKPDGSSTQAMDASGKPITEPKDKTTVNVAGVGLVEYDPENGTTKTLVAAPADATKEVFNVVNGVTYRWDPAKKEWADSGLPKAEEAASVWTDANTDQIVWYDKQGNVVRQMAKPGWEKPPAFQPGQAPQAGTELKMIPVLNPKTGALEWQENKNFQSVTDATSQLASSLGLQVAQGSMSEDQAQKLITNSINAMNAQQNLLSGASTAAGNVISGVNQAAATGAGLLENRAQTAQQLVGNVTGMLTSSGGRYGNYSGGLLNPLPGDFGTNLVQGASDYATALGGGPDVYTSAANLVKRADPTGALGAQAGDAYATLGTMLQRYREVANKPHPIEHVVNQQIAAPPQTTGGMTAPLQATPVGAFTGPPPSMPAGPGNAPPNQVPGANYGTGYNTAVQGEPRWPNPQPLPAGTEVPYTTPGTGGFVAPPRPTIVINA